MDILGWALYDLLPTILAQADRGDEERLLRKQLILLDKTASNRLLPIYRKCYGPDKSSANLCYTLKAWKWSFYDDLEPVLSWHNLYHAAYFAGRWRWKEKHRGYLPATHRCHGCLKEHEDKCVYYKTKIYRGKHCERYKLFCEDCMDEQWTRDALAGKLNIHESYERQYICLIPRIE
jgi:hypothetical protein